MDQTEEIKDIISRIEKLESAVFQRKSKEVLINTKVQNFVGTKGGILLLLSKGYINQLRSALDVKNELAKDKYFYSIQVIQTALNRLSKEKGPIVSMRDSGKKFYVKRK